MPKAAATAAVVLLYLLHQDYWFWHEAHPLVFGFLPIGLFYHAAYTVAAAGILWLLVAAAWPSHLEHGLGEDAGPASGAGRASGPRDKE